MLHEKIENDLKISLKAGEKERAGTLRFLLAAIRNFQIEKKVKDEKFLADEDVIVVLRRQVKQRRDSISEYEKGGRADLAQKEKRELEMLEAYLPTGPAEDQIRGAVQNKMKELGLSQKTDFGRLMGEVMKELSGQADGEMVKKIVEEELNRNEDS